MLPNLIVPTLSRYDLLQRMLNSLDYPIAHLLIIDNGSQLKNVAVPNCVVKVTILSMPANQGVAGSWNLGIKCFPFSDRWFIASDDVEFQSGGLQSWFEQSAQDLVTVSDEWPFFQLIAVGENVINYVGLFDEGIHPANFEDDDFERRCEATGFQVVRVPIAHSHVKQGTVFDGMNAAKNAVTYKSNEEYYRHKVATSDLSPWQWSLQRRRENSWD